MRKRGRKRQTKARKTGPPTQSNGAGAAIPMDGRSVERHLAQIHRLLEGREFDSIEEVNAFLHEALQSGQLESGPFPARTPREEAVELIYDAFEAETYGERVSLARRALELDPDCADAYVLLAEMTAETPEEAAELYRKGMKAAERTLGPEFFQENAGHFWGILETRPYMRAKYGLAQTLWDMGRKDEAVAHLQDMLRLNPNDNQGVRHDLINWLLILKRYSEAESLLRSYKNEPTAVWAYSEAMLEFCRHGETEKANRLLAKAIERNPFVPDYLVGRRKLPDSPPLLVGFGDETEGQAYVFLSAELWVRTPGALPWLARQTRRAM